MVGVTFVIAPFALGFKGIDAWFYWANAAAVLTVVSLNKPGSTQETPTRAGGAAA
jgi:hypothetical protein